AARRIPAGSGTAGGQYRTYPQKPDRIHSAVGDQCGGAGSNSAGVRRIPRVDFPGYAADGAAVEHVAAADYSATESLACDNVLRNIWSAFGVGEDSAQLHAAEHRKADRKQGGECLSAQRELRHRRSD